jgi:hypothetical protein
MSHTNYLPRKAFSFGLAALMFTVCGLVSQSEAQIITLANKNSTAQIDTGSQAGMFNWLVDGQNQLAQQWFWYRVGSSGAESSINTISAPSIVTAGTKALWVTYGNAQYSVEVDYLLNGSTPGSGMADIAETITINNTSGGTLNFHFFQYSDFDLSGTPGAETVTLSTNQFGLVNQIDQRDATMTLQETVATPGANHSEGAFFATTLNALNDALPTTLNDNLGPVGTGDVTWALEWDLTIADGQSVLISKDKRLEVVPEPSTVALVSLGLIALGLQKRRRSA